MKTRPCPPNTRLTDGHVATFQQVLPGRRLAEEQKTLLIGGNQQDTAGLMRVNGHVPMVSPFMGERRGHECIVALPSGKKRIKLVAIHELLPDDDH